MEVSRKLYDCNPHDHMAQASLSTGFRSHLLLVGVVPMSLSTLATLAESNRFVRRPCSVGSNVNSVRGLIGR